MKTKKLIEEIKGKGYSYKEQKFDCIFTGVEITEGYFKPHECPFCGSKKLKRGLGKDFAKLKYVSKWGSISCANDVCERTILLIHKIWNNQLSDRLSKETRKKLQAILDSNGIEPY